MTTAAPVLSAVSPLIEALNRELEPTSEQCFSGRELGHIPWRIWHRALGGPLRDFLERPGKEFRGELTRIFYRIAGKEQAMPENLPLVVEALHAGSLIVDDVEDESSERRGRPALHRIHGVPIALNAGNWLYFWACSLLDEIELGVETRDTARRLTTRALLDCHYGQALDLSVRVSELEQAEVAAVVRAASELKTGSLLGLAAGLGALVGGAREDSVACAVRFGRELGTGLQMLDDLSGITCARRYHKGHEDLLNDRASWTWAWLASSLDEYAFERLRARAHGVARGDDPRPLAAEMQSRLMPQAKQRVHEHLETSHRRLAAAIPFLPQLSVLRREIQRLEKSYG